MINNKLIFSVTIFSIMMFCTSTVKNKTRIIEKEINILEKNIAELENKIYENQLEYFYLSSPKKLSSQIKSLSNDQYLHMEFSNIYLSFDEFIENQKKLTKK